MRLLAILMMFTIVTCFAQEFQTDDKKRKSILENEAITDSKELQNYYKNIFSKKKSASSDLVPSLQINKEDLLGKLKKLIPLDGPVNPDEYMVGPNDVLSINIWGDLPFSFNLPVSPEGSIIIPQIGIVKVGNKKLSVVKKEVENQLRKNFLKGEITTTLIMPRIFNVYVSGLVNNPGTFYASSVQRIDYALYLANLQSKEAAARNTQEEVNTNQHLIRRQNIQYIDDNDLKNNEKNISLRNIKVIRNNNDTLIVDLVRFYATGDLKYNPYLNDGDRVIVQNANLKRNTISISGAVRLEGLFEYNFNDNIRSVFEICQGPTELADLENVDLYRYDLETENYAHQVVNIKEILEGEKPDFRLRAGDRLIVSELNNEKFTSTVTLKGEVNKPGVYPVKKGETTLTELIQMAGGFTKSASLPESKIIRFPKSLDTAEENPDFNRMNDMRLGNINDWDRKYLNFEYAIKRNYVVANFVKLFHEKDEKFEVYLEDKDIILIPPTQNTVYVYGQVANPGYIKYNPALDYADYISLAGGISEMAIDGDIQLIKAGSKNWVDPDNSKIEAGDAIFVPRERDSGWEYFFGWFSKIVTVVGGLVSSVYIITTIK